MFPNMSDKETFLALLDLIADVGIPSVIKGIQQFSFSDNPSPDEIRALKIKLKDPDYYFNPNERS